MEDLFLQISNVYSNDRNIIDTWWQRIQTAYAEKHRHYHNLNHIKSVIDELYSCKDDINDWEATCLAAFFHDIVYEPLRKDNEERSADVADIYLSNLNMPEKQRNSTRQFIIATKKHEPLKTADINYFTDADLSVLGWPLPLYENYVRQIREEYKWYPDLIYKPGRRKVLEHFLKMDRIFKTDYFYSKYEVRAKENILSELARYK